MATKKMLKVCHQSQNTSNKKQLSIFDEVFKEVFALEERIA